MANIKSARKRAKQAIVRRDHNMSLRTQVRTAIKSVKKAVASGNKDAAAKSLGGNGLPSCVTPWMTNSTTAGSAMRRIIGSDMEKPASRILVINDESLELRELVKGLNAAARSLDNPLGISFSGVSSAKEALAAIERDGDLQAVLVDDTLYTLKNGRPSKGQTSWLELVQRITPFPPALAGSIVIAREEEDHLVH